MIRLLGFVRDKLKPQTSTSMKRPAWLLISAGLVLGVAQYLAGPSSLGDFEGQTDVGGPGRPGSVEYDAAHHQYRITGGGENMWSTKDAFHYVWRRMSGDMTLTAEVAWPHPGGNPHRKAGWVVRQGLGPSDPYADLVVHGSGLTSLQYREVEGGQTKEVQSALSMPQMIRLIRQGDTFELWTAPKGGALRSEGSVKVRLHDPVYVGLAVCAHDDKALETAVFSDVSVENRVDVESDNRPVESRLETISIDGSGRKVLYTAEKRFEAPNWSRDGKYLLFNSGGRIYKLFLNSKEPHILDTGTAIRCNNDHGLSPDGNWLAVSNSPVGPSLIYILPAMGGQARLVTPQGPSYWHGWSPDGKTLAYCAERNGNFDVYTIPAKGGKEKRLTTAEGLDDGPDYSPDGKYIYFNSVRTGLMQIWRMKPDGSDQEQVTHDDYNNWFAHPSPDGKWLVFITFDKSVIGHPPNKDVMLRIIPVSGGQPRVLAKLFGGQGTINVPSWSPDSRQIAFVSYRLLDQ